MESAREDPAPAVELVGVTAGYSRDRPVLRELTRTLTGPGLVRLDGSNGAGKSTLIEVASGYLRPFAGECRVDGRVAGDPEARRGRRVCRTAPALHPNLSVLDHLAVAADLTGTDRGELTARAAALGLDEWERSRTSALSTGTAKKLWWLLCTAGRFRVALLDEPFNGVDERSVSLMVDEVREWSRDGLVVLVCHSVPSGLRVDATESLPGRGLVA